MKLTPRQSPRDGRTEPLPLAIDEAGLAQWVQSARTPEEAWKQLNLPGGRADLDPGAVDALAKAATELCAIGDAIGKGRLAVAERSKETPLPASWVERLVELYVALLEGYWRLDDLAYAGLKTGGWTVTTPEPPADDPAGRIAQRARWVAEENKPTTPALWFDKLDRALGREVAECLNEGELENVRGAGRELVEEATRDRFTSRYANRRTTT